MRVCILGDRGMLGHMLSRYLGAMGVTVLTLDGRWSDKFKHNIKQIKCDYLINCIAALPQKSATFDINYEIPIWLDKHCHCKGILLPGTDIGPGTEYGQSKTLAKNFVVNSGQKTKIIECSIIGPELVGASSLMQWFLNSSSSVNGYTNLHWNGITSLEWSKIAYQLICHWDNFDTIIKPYTDTISKMQLLLHIKDVWNVTTRVVPIRSSSESFMPFEGDLYTQPIETQLFELKSF